MTLAWPSLVLKSRPREEPWLKIEAGAASASKGEDVPRGGDAWQRECQPPEQASPSHPEGGLLLALAHNPLSREILGCLCVWVSGKLDVLRTM